MENFEGLKKQLTQLAEVLNQFKSEAVQLRILDVVLGDQNPGEAKPEFPSKPVTKSLPRRTKTKKAAAESGTSDKLKKSTGGAGAGATLTRLTQSDFFDQARTINDIIEHCKHNLARTFKANEFSGKLARLVRTGALVREKNSDNQYEYKKS